MRRYSLGEAAIDTQAQPQTPSVFAAARAEGGPSEEAGYYVFSYTLGAKELQANLTRFIDGDSDFALFSIHGKSTSTYNINITDFQGKPIYSSSVDASLAVGNAQVPLRIKPALLYPAGGKIGISLEDTSNAPNTVTLVFTGVRKFRTQ